MEFFYFILPFLFILIIRRIFFTNHKPEPSIKNDTPQKARNRFKRSMFRHQSRGIKDIEFAKMRRKYPIRCNPDDWYWDVKEDRYRRIVPQLHTWKWHFKQQCRLETEIARQKAMNGY